MSIQDPKPFDSTGKSLPRTVPSTPVMSPGDEAAPGTPGTAEGICRRCGGTGQDAGAGCPECGGTGRVTVGIGGA